MRIKADINLMARVHNAASEIPWVNMLYLVATRTCITRIQISSKWN